MGRTELQHGNPLRKFSRRVRAELGQQKGRARGRLASMFWRIIIRYRQLALLT